MAGNSGYSSAQILSMQKDAVRRVNEMQRIARERLQRTENAMGAASAAPPQRESGGQTHAAPERDTPPSVPASGRMQAPTSGSPFTGILDRIGLDSESTLLLLLLVLLVNEGADNMLILALVYILL